jgi:hypothetical protein
VALKAFDDGVRRIASRQILLPRDVENKIERCRSFVIN